MSFIDLLANSEPLIQRVTTSPAPPDLNCLRPYIVNDILPNDPKLFLFFESPDVHEVCQGYPLAGASGRDVTRTLSEVFGIPEEHQSLPFGKALNTPELHNHPGLSEVGIMNVSNVPLQSTPYCTAVRQRFAPLLERFKTIRNGPTARSRRNPTTGEIEQLIIHCLRRRIEATRNDAYFVLCGQVAKAFFQKAAGNDRTRFQTITVPHPSYGNWKKERYRLCISRLKCEIRKILNLQ